MSSITTVFHRIFQGERQLQKWGHKPIMLAIFPVKLHKIAKEIGPRVGGASLETPPRVSH